MNISWYSQLIMFELIKKCIYIIVLQYVMFSENVLAQQSHIVIDQGELVGLKVFPDSSRSAVYAFLGIPYAQPPIGYLRFAPPKLHNGWEGILQAMSLKPICPQLTNTIYDEAPDGKQLRPPSMSEDCLYLNIWVPEDGLHYGNLPVIAVVTGEEMSYDWPRNRASGLDLASDGVIVVNIQYRTNIFGWISLNNSNSSGNYGLLDQELALKWIQNNIRHFGGNAEDISLLGHGTSGAVCTFAIAMRDFSPEHRKPLIKKIILMSGGNIKNSIQSKPHILDTSRTLIQKLGCHFETIDNEIANCLRNKSVSDLLNAFESIYHNNKTFALGPINAHGIQSFLNSIKYYRNQKKIRTYFPSILMGITTNEGAFMQEYWLDLAREGYERLSSYINATVLTNILQDWSIDPIHSNQFNNAIHWKYFSGDATHNTVYLLKSLQTFISESKYELPFYEFVENYSSNNESNILGTLYAYVFEISNSMDMRGKINLFGGASHSSDLPLLLGPGLFQQISRRRFTAEENKISEKMRKALVNFAKEGNPTPGRIFDGWLPYTSDRKFIYKLGDTIKKSQNNDRLVSTFQSNLMQIYKLLKEGKKNDNKGVSRSNRYEYRSPYQQTELDNQYKKSSYLTNEEDSGYALHLNEVYSFWYILLSNYGIYNHIERDSSNIIRRVSLMENATDSARYRRAFFAMLCLVCILLVILSLCVYLLHRDPLGINPQLPRCCL